MDDVGRFLRLQAAVKAAADSIEPAQAPIAGDTMRDLYLRLRQNALEVIPKEHVNEFEGLFPPDVTISHTNPPDHFIDSQKRFSTARSQLVALAGWLDGYVAEARMQLEATEYAEARVREERGTGFRPPEGNA